MRFTPICNHRHAWMAEIQVWRVLVMFTYYRTHAESWPPIEVLVYWLKENT